MGEENCEGISFGQISNSEHDSRLSDYQDIGSSGVRILSFSHFLVSWFSNMLLPDFLLPWYPDDLHLFSRLIVPPIVIQIELRVASVGAKMA